VSFELFMVGASIWALRKGVSAVPLWAELAAHVACWTVAASAFASFYVVCEGINARG
jgi:hypothetical protein